MHQKDIDEMRAFNRFYTSLIGLLNTHILNSEYSLSEARILFELYHNSGMTASDIIALIHIDKGYLSRILKHFELKKLIVKKRSSADKRSVYLNLTSKGKKELEILSRASDVQITKILSQLTDDECKQLISNLREVKGALEKVKG
jgi:DNA-binding MarR family transcriptional regulator